MMAMASILTPEDVVRRIAAECTFIDERGAVGIRLKPAAAIVRQYGEQFRRPVPAKAKPWAKAAAAAVIAAARLWEQVKRRPVWSGILRPLQARPNPRRRAIFPYPEYFDRRLGLGAGTHRATKSCSRASRPLPPVKHYAR
jgi:hypothetical protein